MISETRPVKHCPTYLKLSSHGRTVDHCTYYWESCFEQCKGYFLPSKGNKLCVMCNETWSESSRVWNHVMASPTSQSLFTRDPQADPVPSSHREIEAQEPQCRRALLCLNLLPCLFSALSLPETCQSLLYTRPPQSAVSAFNLNTSFLREGCSPPFQCPLPVLDHQEHRRPQPPA